VDGYWQLLKDEKAESLCMHQPLLQAQPQQKKPQKINKGKFEDVLNQKTNNPVKRNHEFELFNDEFNKEAPPSNLTQLNQKQKKAHQPTSLLFLDEGPLDGSTKPSISPEEKSFQNDINLSNDEFFASTFKPMKEKVSQESKPIPQPTSPSHIK
jgi:hypothetical protein